MSATNLFGRVIGPTDVEDVLAASLTEWLPDCLGEAERLFGYAPGTIDLPRNIVSSSEWQHWPENQIPVVVIVNAGLAGPPTRRSNGTYDASWRIGICPIVSDQTQDTTRDLAQAYTVACRLAVLQHKRMRSSAYPNGLGESWLTWVDEQYHDMPVLATRSMDSGRVVIDVGVEGVITEMGGPRTPTGHPQSDPGAWPTSTSVPDPTITLVSLTEAIP